MRGLILVATLLMYATNVDAASVEGNAATAWMGTLAGWAIDNDEYDLAINSWLASFYGGYGHLGIAMQFCEQAYENASSDAERFVIVKSYYMFAKAITDPTLASPSIFSSGGASPNPFQGLLK